MRIRPRISRILFLLWKIWQCLKSIEVEIDQSGGLFGTWYLSFECTASMKGDILQHRYDRTSEPSFEMDPCACKVWRMSGIRNFDQISECNFHKFRINRLSDLRDHLSRIS